MYLQFNGQCIRMAMYVNKHPNTSPDKRSTQYIMVLVFTRIQTRLNSQVTALIAVLANVEIFVKCEIQYILHYVFKI